MPHRVDQLAGDRDAGRDRRQGVAPVPGGVDDLRARAIVQGEDQGVVAEILRRLDRGLEPFAHDLGGVKPGPYVQLSVSDTGAGMTPEVVRHAFEPYFTTKGPGKGTGLGLSSLYGFVKQSHGHVNIYSEPGRGTVVNVFLPRLGAVETQPEQRGPRSPHGRGRGETVLVVEDNAQVRRLTVERLRRLGYRIIEAENGPQALEILKQAVRVDIVFSDVVMPGGMSGFDLAREVRTGVTGAHVLLTSGFSEAAARGEGVHRRPSEVVEPPPATQSGR